MREYETILCLNVWIRVVRRFIGVNDSMNSNSSKNRQNFKLTVTNLVEKQAKNAQNSSNSVDLKKRSFFFVLLFDGFDEIFLTNFVKIDLTEKTVKFVKFVKFVIVKTHPCFGP